MFLRYKSNFRTNQNGPIRSTVILGLLCLLSLFLTSCTGVVIKPFEIPAQISKLKSTNKKSINLEVRRKGAFEPAGHQYLMVAIPFGRVWADDPEVGVFNKAYTNLALKGFKVNQSAKNKNKTIIITINNFQLTAYDLFFLRRLYCQFDLSVEMQDFTKKVKFTGNFKTEKSQYKAMGFKEQLEHIYGQCLDEAVNKALVDIY